MVDKDAAVGLEALPRSEGRTDHLHVARVLRDKLEAFLAGAGSDGASMRAVLDVAATELAISAHDHEASINTSAVSNKRLRSEVAAYEHDDHTACGHICSEHAELMRPSVWENLPRELLPLIFARLPLPDIGRLRSVSKEWQKSVDSTDSEFSQELQAVNHSMLALISPTDNAVGDFHVRLYDVRTKVWHCYEMHATVIATSTLGAVDGGLVCFLSVDLDGPLSFVVINPFTMSSRTLPSPPRLCEVQPLMVHLSANAQTGKYKLMVAGISGDRGRGLAVEVYDSGTNQWTNADPSERWCGYGYDWVVNQEANWFEDVLVGPCVCAEGQLGTIWKADEEKVWQRPNVESYVLMKGRLFVLHKDAQRQHCHSFVYLGSAIYSISEFEHNGSAWVKVASHSCEPFQHCPKPEYKMSLLAACGYLMVFAGIGSYPPYYHECGWLYQLSTKAWTDLPALPKEYNFHADRDGVLCDAKWSAMP